MWAGLFGLFRLRLGSTIRAMAAASPPVAQIVPGVQDAAGLADVSQGGPQPGAVLTEERIEVGEHATESILPDDEPTRLLRGRHRRHARGNGGGGGGTEKRPSTETTGQRAAFDVHGFTPFCSERCLGSGTGTDWRGRKKFALSYQSASSHTSPSASAPRRARGRRAADCQSPSVKVSHRVCHGFRGRDKSSDDQRCVRPTALDPISWVSGSEYDVSEARRHSDNARTRNKFPLTGGAGDDDHGLTSGVERSGNIRK